MNFKDSTHYRSYLVGECPYMEALARYLKECQDLRDKPDVSATVLPSKCEFKRNGVRFSLVVEQTPSERILYYTGHTKFSNEPMFAGPLTDPTKDYVQQLRDEQHVSRYMGHFGVPSVRFRKDDALFSYRTLGGNWNVDTVDGRYLQRQLTYVNVGTVGHVDYMGPREEALSPLQQAIRRASNGR